ncbi:hypothetical protein BDFB_012756 [Asbolus verrucosus]|uniref:Uncharacterized protein n=1 Tax=Asbolus verrucosus TaxID=1661398 RepID=A0A482VJV4_ASBVE|nr:hypothetical protein BDFB_012756 [Asbolus verrucosus]
MSTILARKQYLDTSSQSSSCGDNGLINIHKKKLSSLKNPMKKKKITMIANPKTGTSLETSTKEFIVVIVKKALDGDTFTRFLNTYND